VGKQLLGIMRYNFAMSREQLFDTHFMLAHLAHSIGQAVFSLWPIFVVLLFSAIAGPLALGGWLFSAKSLAPKLNRIDPLAGLKRMFSLRSLVELFKSIGKVLVVVATAYVVLSLAKHDLMGLAQEELEQGIYHSLWLSVIATVALSATTIFIAAVDIPFQIHEHNKKLKMSRQEIKDELKDSEGKPEVKSKIRQLQHQMAQQRMMAAVPEADVIITNPTHFSVALKYDPASMDTPVLLAKGVDHMAMKIREIARAHKIEFVEAPTLARAIYHTTEMEEEVPQGLYRAVAQVLAYVFQLKEYRRGRGEKPSYPRHLEVPKDMRY